MGRGETFSNTSARIQGNVVKALKGYFLLKNFIHAIRSCKTLAEERAIVAKESAAIRTGFKEDISAEQRYHAIGKLLYIYMMGYPAHFGQVESLKMAASPRLMDKRIGYLGSTQLMDEHQPTITLITNSIKNDLNSASQTVVALALSNLATTVSPDIARDLSDEVERLLQSPSPYIKKKAAICAARLVNRVCELGESFERHVVSLVSDRNHGVVLGGVTLVEQLCRADGGYIGRERNRLVPILIRQLQGIISSGYSAEHDIGGTADPHLQVRLLRALRILGSKDVLTSQEMSDVLTQVATSTDSSKNVGHAVLYETAVTIMNVESDPSLRTMAINILGRLLSANSSDTNLRFVSLSLLCKIIAAGQDGLLAVQRHCGTILDCLSDLDTSIQRRAIDLAISLSTRETICDIMPKLLALLSRRGGSLCEQDFKRSFVTRLAVTAAQFAPSAKWYVDTMIFILAQIDSASSMRIFDGVAGPLASEQSLHQDQIVSSFVRIVNNTMELHVYAVQQLYRATVLEEPLVGAIFRGRPCRQTDALVQAAIWHIGEFGDILISARLLDEGQLIRILCDWAPTAHSLADGDRPPAWRAAFLISALGKVANRLPSQENRSQIAAVLDRIASDFAGDNYELQGRALEMRAIVSDAMLCASLLSRIPADSDGDQLGRLASASRLPSSRLASASGAALSDTAAPPSPVEAVLDIFAELATLSLDGKGEAAASPSAVPPGGGEGSLLGGGEAITGTSGLLAFDRDDVKVYFRIDATLTTAVQVVIDVDIVNDGAVEITDVYLQCAVPKSVKLQLESATAAFAMPSTAICQTMRVSCHDREGSDAVLNRERLKLRNKLSYRVGLNGEEQVHVFDVSPF